MGTVTATCRRMGVAFLFGESYSSQSIRADRADIIM